MKIFLDNGLEFRLHPENSGELVKCFKHGRSMPFVLTYAIFHMQRDLGVYPAYLIVYMGKQAK